MGQVSLSTAGRFDNPAYRPNASRNATGSPRWKRPIRSPATRSSANAGGVQPSLANLPLGGGTWSLISVLVLLIHG